MRNGNIAFELPSGNVVLVIGKVFYGFLQFLKAFEIEFLRYKGNQGMSRIFCLNVEPDVIHEKFRIEQIVLTISGIDS